VFGRTEPALSGAEGAGILIPDAVESSRRR
jgi:hypothetical protein